MLNARLSPAAQTRPPATTFKGAIGGGLPGAALVALTMAVAALKPDGGKSNAAYLDIAKIPIVGYGHRARDVSRVGSTRTDAQCDALLTSDARATLTAVSACTPTIAERPQQLAAATRLAFNVGAHCRSPDPPRHHNGRRSARRPRLR